MQVIMGYKLLRQRKNGTLGSLFINRKAVIPLGEWLRAESYPTKGYKIRPGWHLTREPYAPHLSENGRVWAYALIDDWTEEKRPESQGGTWFLAKWMKLHSIV